MLGNERFGRGRNPFDTERVRGHRHVGGAITRGPRERHFLIAAIAVAVVAAAAGAYSAYAQGQAQAAAARYNARVAENNATNSRNAAAVEAQVRGEHYRRQMASQRAAIGASGIAPDEGSPLLVQMDSAEQASLDLARVRYAGEVRASNYGAEQNLQKYYAKQYVQAGYVGAGTALLGGVSSGFSAYAGASARATRYNVGNQAI